jgi:hypothetical protein
MAAFTYFQPSNERVEGPTADQVVASMRGDVGFRGPYSPVGQLHWDGPGRCMLYFVRHPRRGWYIEHNAGFEDSQGPRRHLVAVDPSAARDAWVEQWAEGETSYFLAACFLPQEVAEQVVREFMASRQPSSAVAWEPIDWRVHRREGPPDDESLVVEEAEYPE